MAACCSFVKMSFVLVAIILLLSCCHLPFMKLIFTGSRHGTLVVSNPSELSFGAFIWGSYEVQVLCEICTGWVVHSLNSTSMNLLIMNSTSKNFIPIALKSVLVEFVLVETVQDGDPLYCLFIYYTNGSWGIKSKGKSRFDLG